MIGVCGFTAARLRRMHVVHTLVARDGYATPRSLSEAAGITYGAATYWLCMNEHRGLVEHAQRGRYVLSRPWREAFATLSLARKVAA